MLLTQPLGVANSFFGRDKGRTGRIQGGQLFKQGLHLMDLAVTYFLNPQGSSAPRIASSIASCHISMAPCARKPKPQQQGAPCFSSFFVVRCRRCVAVARCDEPGRNAKRLGAKWEIPSPPLNSKYIRVFFSGIMLTPDLKKETGFSKLLKSMVLVVGSMVSF